MTALRHPRPRTRFTLSHFTRRLDDHRTPLGLLVLAVIMFLTYISIVAINGVPFSHPESFRAVLPATGPIIARGDDVRIAGQRVGDVTTVTPLRNGRLVQMSVNAGERVGRDARAIIRLQGLAGATYLQIDPGDPSRPAPAGYTIPLARTSTNTQLTDVIASFDAATRRDLAGTLTAYGAGLTGQGSNVNQAIADLPPLLADTRPVLSAFNPTPGALAGFVHNLNLTLIALRGHAPGDIAGLLGAAQVALGTIVAQHAALGRSIDDLRPLSDQAQRTLPIADPVLIDASAAARSLDPAVGALENSLPSLNALLARTAQVPQLTRLSAALSPVLTAARPVLAALWPAAASLAPLAVAIEPLAQYAAQYRQEILGGPTGFTTWGGFRYNVGVARGARAVRFAPVFTCTPGRDPYPSPGQVEKDRRACPQ
jgi:virulence factor Mce-like protein